LYVSKSVLSLRARKVPTWVVQIFLRCRDDFRAGQQGGLLSSIVSDGWLRACLSFAGMNAPAVKARILKNRRVVFNIKGNDYRVVVAVTYGY
jgi:hypothetical protein